MRILLDTNAYSRLARGERKVADLARSAEWVLFSPIVYGELVFGFRLGRNLEQNLTTLNAFIGAPYVSFLSITVTTADRYSRIAASQRSKGRPIPTNDMWIAAHAMEMGADLVSADRHFELVDGIALVPIEAHRPGMPCF